MSEITIFDYGAGNIHSLAKALALTGNSVGVETDPIRATDTDLLVLPGVGAFQAAAARLGPGRLRMRDAIRDGLPTIGVCLGMQLFFETSEEGPGEGLGLIEGRVTRLRAERVPHIGWNSLEQVRDPVFARSPLDVAYFAHGYACRPVSDDTVTAWVSEGGDRFPAVVRAGRAVGVQFHPEKSSRAGVDLLGALVEEALR